MSDLSPEYLAGIRSAAGSLLDDSIIRVERRGGGYALVEVQAAGLDDEDDRDTVRHLAYTETLGGAETIRTLLQAVPRLLDEVERLRTELDETTDGLAEQIADLCRIITVRNDAIRRVRGIHAEYRIYDECDHSHTDEDVAAGRAADVADVGYVCDNGLISVVCRECCTSVGYQTEECATRHDWHFDEGGYHCRTIRALDGETS